MLRNEDAQKRLEAYRIQDWAKKRAAALGKLPAKLAGVGRAFLGYDANGKEFADWQKRKEAKQLAHDSLADLSADQRGKLFQVLFPKIAAPLEAGWQLLGRSPYQLGYARKAFRAPGNADAYRARRAVWLESLISHLGGFDENLTWFAAWSPYLNHGYGADSLGILLAAAIDAGGQEGEAIFDVLRASATNEHEIGSMGRHVTRGLLAASRPDGWEFIEKLLLAAQRQEGLRQVILEAIDEAHPQAFRRMVRLLLDENLLRFSAAVRAVDVWFGLGWDALSTGVVQKTLETVARFLEDSQARSEAISKGDPQSVYFALWTLGFEDAMTAVKPASDLLRDADTERRFVAAHFLGQLDLPSARAALVDVVEDENLSLATRAFAACSQDASLDLFERAERLLERLPEKAILTPALVWPWMMTRLDRAAVADALPRFRRERPMTVLLPYLNQMSGWERGRLVEELAGQQQLDAAMRDALFALVGDSNSWVREKALEAVKNCAVNESEVPRLEGFLSRKNAGLRRGVLSLLQKQKTPDVLASADRLLASSKANQRVAALELLRSLVEAKRSVAECRQRAEQYRSKRRQLGEEEQLHLEAIFDIRRVVPKLDDALGLMAGLERTPVRPPKKHKIALFTPAALACLTALDDLIEQHKETSVRIQGHEGTQDELLGNLNAWSFPSPDADKPLESDAARLPLRSLWEEWLAGRPRKSCDKDGLELVRALVHVYAGTDFWKEQNKQYGKEWKEFLAFASAGLSPFALRRPHLVEHVMQWLLRLHPPAGAIGFGLDALETLFALVPSKVLSRVVDVNDWRARNQDWRNESPANYWLGRYWGYFPLCRGGWEEKDHERWWHLMHWRDEPVAGVARFRPQLVFPNRAHRVGYANDADVFDQLLTVGSPFNDLQTATAVQPPEWLSIGALVERCRARILEIELARGELPTAASAPARALQSVFGLDMLMRELIALGKKPFARFGYGVSRNEVLTHLIAVTYPNPEDTPEEFAARMKQAKIDADRLIDLSFVAPQWLTHIEHSLGWAGLREAAWWFFAHVGNRSGLGGGDREAWERLIRERTSLTPQERGEGLIDPAWFHRAHAALGKKRWNRLAESAKYIASGQGHKKAIHLANVLLGRAKKSDLIASIRVRQLRDAVRLLGLLPLANGDKRDKDLLQRYRVLQEYRRYARSLSPMSRESAVRAGDIGLENLARTAGYTDPIRLEWAMETHEIADLAAGPLTASHQGVTVTLALDEQAQVQFTVQRGDKPLKNIPSTIRKHPKIALLADRKSELKRQASRMRLSLENAMCRGDAFSAAELRQLFEHPLLAPALERLVLLGEGVAGFPTAKGKALIDPRGKIEPIKSGEQLRLAHPHDLLSGGEWHLWQKHLFETERVQPFKQVFREVYVVTEQERTGDNVSHRYAGHQVNPQQALALFGSRGWGTREGVRKIFHEVGLVAEVSFRSGAWTPLELEGLTLEGVSFHKRDEWKPMPLADVPPRLFSETMRDVDLVVSVAHLGGVDPEASASTLEMRAALLRETCALLKIDNYRLEKSHAIIDGFLNKYNVHLGSAVVHRMPGGSLCIVPVHAQQRGRLFLPFADDDPRTAEVLSKVILLARDGDIQDPSILEQLR
jgi:HEAT repeat protein